MDSFTHGLLAFYLLSLTGIGLEFLLAGVVGAMFPDIDILFRRISDRYPGYFIFTHGGFTHSLLGTLAIAAGLTALTALLALSGFPVPAPGPILFAVFLAGSLVHVGLDILAYPGIPVLFPFSTKKHTLGIFPGPSLFIFGVTAVFLVLVLLGIQSLMAPYLYLAIVIGYIAFRIIMKTAIAITQDGITIPRMNPFHWFIIHETEGGYVLETYRVGGGRETLGQFPRYQNITREELDPILNLPEVRRHLYYSYLSVAERKNDTVILYDPLRMKKFIWYPPDYVTVEIPMNREI